MFLTMSSRRRIPHIVGTSPIAWYGSITSHSSPGGPGEHPSCEGWRLDPKLLADQPVDLATIGAALGLAHHRSDERAHRLGVAAADALDDVLVLGDHLGDDVRQLVAALHRRQALALDDRRRVAALGHQLVEHPAPGAGVDRARLDEADQPGQRVRADLALPRVGLGADARP